MPTINLLPWRDAERKRRRQEFMLGTVAALAGAGLVWLLVNWQFESAIEYQNGRNQYLRNEIAELDKQITEILGLEQQKQRLIARMEIIEQLQRSRPEVVHLFDQLVRTLPEGVYLTSVVQNNKRLQLKGVAQSSTRVSTYMRNLDASEWLENPALEVVQTTGDAGANFTLYANQVSKVTPDDAAAGTGGQGGAQK
ncbi:MAG TPA: PilN domain-containing protein [Steroidobacteraceae bacterium]|nr:PilN domain-containing protein [Steroidobacteraceae bacterium]